MDSVRLGRLRAQIYLTSTMHREGYSQIQCASEVVMVIKTEINQSMYCLKCSLTIEMVSEHFWEKTLH